MPLPEGKSERKAMITLSKQVVQGDFVKKVKEISGQNILKCNSCGKCSAGCPLAFAMDHLPNQVMRMAQLGQEEILQSKTIWMCASCLTCASRCPQGIDLASVMDALRLIVLRSGVPALSMSDLEQEHLLQAPQLAFISSMRKYMP
ncbi:MAG: 4Fe-4S dicluster domain-containing protein [Chloroflexota bacterium]|jgi:heterodisulfide reductase subunit C